MDPHWQHDLGKLMDNGKSSPPFSDLTLLFADGVELRTHKFLLAAHSNLVKTMLKRNPARSNLFLKNAESSTMKSVLQYIYRGFCSLDHLSLLDCQGFARTYKFKQLLEHLQSVHNKTAAGTRYKEICSRKMKTLVNHQASSDVMMTLVDRDGVTHKFYGHKAILSARSDVFFAQLNGSFARNSRESFSIPADVSARAFKEFLTYLYTGKLSGSLSVLDDAEEKAYVFLDLLQLSSIYLLLGLKQLVGMKVSHWVAVENAVEFLEVALLYQCKEMFNRIVSFIVNRYTYFRKNGDFQNLPEEARDAVEKERLKVTCWSYKAPPRAPWVDDYLASPHGSAVRSGSVVPRSEILKMGYTESDITAFKKQRKERRNKLS